MTAAFNFAGFGAPAQTQAPAQNGQRPKAQLWLNVGMMLPVTKADGTVATEFVSPFGIPLDYIEPFGGNSDYSSHKNTILAQVRTAAQALQPGESKIVAGAGNVVLEIRRSGGAQTATAGSNVHSLVAAAFGGVEAPQTEEAAAS